METWMVTLGLVLMWIALGLLAVALIFPKGFPPSNRRHESTQDEVFSAPTSFRDLKPTRHPGDHDA